MRLWLKLTLAGALLLAVVLGMVHQGASRLLTETVVGQLRDQGQALARPLASALAGPLRHRDPATVQTVLDEIARDGRLQALRLVDGQGRTQASTGAGLPPAPVEAASAGPLYTDARGEPAMDFSVPLQAAGEPLGTLTFTLSAHALDDGLALLHQRLAIASLLALGLLALLATVGSRLLAAPLERLASATERLRAGEFDTALPGAGNPDEVGALAASLSGLRDAVRDRVSQLAQARDAAEARSRAKTLFLANTSHELRTPLNGLLGMARLAQQPGLDDARRQRYLDLLFDSGKLLADILNDTLDLARIESGKLSLDPRPFDPRALLNDTVATYRPLAEAAGLTLEGSVDADVPAQVLGDLLRVRQIVANYLSNALKFTGRGQVRVRLSVLRGEHLRLAVTDTGPGIAPAVQGQLFTPFTQGDAGTATRHGGSGLGLAICRELAELMDGRVGVDSPAGPDAPGGSTFWAELRLPATAVVPEAPALPEPGPETLRGARALVVEDDPIGRMLVLALLESWGLSVVQAYDGEQALAEVGRAQAEGRPFDLVLMDLQMPVMDGLAVTRLLRQRFDAVTLPIIAVTAAALATERDAALRAGINAIVTKPIDAPRLRAQVGAVLRRGPAR